MYDKDDYLIEVLQGRHNYSLPQGSGFIVKTKTYKEVVDRKLMVQRLKKRLEAHFFKEGISNDNTGI